MPFVSDEEFKRFERLQEEQRDREENAIDLSRDFKDPATFAKAHEEIEQLPTEHRQEWLTKLVREQTSQFEALDAPSRGPLGDDAKAVMHEELRAARTPEATREILRKYNQIDE